MQKLTSFAAIAAMAAMMVPSASAAALTGETISRVDGSTGFPSDTDVSYTLVFTSTGALDDTSDITIGIPNAFTVTSATLDTISISSGTGTASSFNSTSANNTDDSFSAGYKSVTGQISGTVDAGDEVTIGFSGVDTPTEAGFYAVQIATQDSVDAAVDTGSATLNVPVEGAVALSSSALGATDVTYTFTLSGLPALDEADQIVLSFPGDLDITGAADNVTAGLTGTVTDTVYTATGGVVLTVDAASTVAGGTTDLVVEISSVDNASTAGVYAIGVDIYDEGTTLIAQGNAPASIASQVDITAIVTEALIMTLANTGGGSGITLQVDPAVNNGQDKTEATTITVQSNAGAGYTLRAELDDGAGNARLVNGDGDPIGTNSNDNTVDASNAANLGNDNYLGYSATNNDSTPNSGDDALNAFDQDPTTLYSAAGSSALGNSGPVDPVAEGNDTGVHTVNYDLNVSFLTPAGVYTGTIYYTIVANF